MELMLRGGGYVPDGRGGLRRAEGSDAVLQRVLWKLTVRRGSFPFLPGLGSRLYLLNREKPGDRRVLARQYVAEALAGEADLTVREVSLEGERLRVDLTWRGEPLSAGVALGGGSHEAD